MLSCYLCGHLVTLLVGLVRTVRVRDLPHHPLAGVVRHGGAHGHLHVLGHLHCHLLTHLRYISGWKLLLQIKVLQLFLYTCLLGDDLAARLCSRVSVTGGTSPESS